MDGVPAQRNGPNATDMHGLPRQNAHAGSSLDLASSIPFAMPAFGFSAMQQQALSAFHLWQEGRIVWTCPDLSGNYQTNSWSLHCQWPRLQHHPATVAPHSAAGRTFLDESEPAVCFCLATCACRVRGHALCHFN